MAGKIELKGLFEGLQNQMVAQLNTNRDFIQHSSSKGDSLESTWIEWLRKYLPNRYSIDKAIVIDHEGSLSDQIDLVIYDQQFTPFVFTQNGIHYIPAEGVYAVFEVKPDLAGSVQVAKKKSIGYIEYASEKVESVRMLKRTSTYIIDRGERKNPRSLTKIIGGILTSTNSIKKRETIKSKLGAGSKIGALDMCCVADYGSIILDYEGVEDLNITGYNERILDYYEKRVLKEIRFSDSAHSLISFFLQLTRYLQQSIGTVAAIDLNAYAKEIGFDLDNEI
ncbi:MAG: hypothetical protein EOO15_10365 [Chitinophagaceae bacterium]|nr:MAG: hypothetical protein EOO15_10365 [Chitinophagaceae bacterium]